MRKCFLAFLLLLTLFGCTPTEVPQTVVEPSPEVQETAPIVEAPVQEAPAEQETPPVQESAPVQEEKTVPTCTISISCQKLLDQIHLCDSEKVELLPKDGWILPPTEVEYIAGESVFDLLLRVCKARGILMEYSDTPMYDSAYIEGIANLYEFDGGPLSGWMYSVNGACPNYGSSRYSLEENDTVCWQYTCDLGADVGGAQR